MYVNNYNNDNKTKSGLGIVSIFEVVGIVFIVLKLCKVIDWSWWLVLLPIYAPIFLYFFIIGVAVCLYTWLLKKRGY